LRENPHKLILHLSPSQSEVRSGSRSTEFSQSIERTAARFDRTLAGPWASHQTGALSDGEGTRLWVCSLFGVSCPDLDPIKHIRHCGILAISVRLANLLHELSIFATTKTLNCQIAQ
jgi:hypothetical protein